MGYVVLKVDVNHDVCIRHLFVTYHVSDVHELN